MKVAFVAANTFQYDARQLRSAAALAGDGHQVTLVGLAGEGLPDREEIEGGIVLRRVAFDGTIASAFRPLPRIVRRGLARLLGIGPGATSLPPGRPSGLDRLRAPVRRIVEIVAHARRVGPWRDAVLGAVPDADIFTCKALIALPVIRSAARKSGGRFVYDIADIHTEAARLARMPGWFRALVRRLERGWMHEAAGLIAGSPDLADEVVRRFGVERPTIVLNCPPAWRPGETTPARTGRLREIAGVASDRPLVLYQGGFSVDRGIEELVGALQDPRLAARDVVLVFMGYGRLRSWLDEQAARQPGRIVVVQAVPPHELLEYTADADVGFVGQPPRTLNQRLNLANKFFEYLQVGVPVITAEGTAHCRLTREHAVGQCVEIDAPSIAAAIDELLGAEPGERERLRLHTRAVGLEQFTWENHSVNVIQLYRALEGRSDPAGRSQVATN